MECPRYTKGCRQSKARKVLQRSDHYTRLYYQKKLAGRSDPRTKTLALIALARHRARRLYKVLRRALLPSAEVAA